MADITILGSGGFGLALAVLCNTVFCFTTSDESS